MTEWKLITLEEINERRINELEKKLKSIPNKKYIGLLYWVKIYVDDDIDDDELEFLLKNIK